MAGRVNDGRLLMHPVGTTLVSKAQSAGVLALRALPVLDVAILGAGSRLGLDVCESVDVV